MSRTNYARGVRLEREIVNLFRAAGWDAARTAGSHGPWDVTVRGAQQEPPAQVLLRAGWRIDLASGPWSYCAERNTRRGTRQRVWYSVAYDGATYLCVLQCKSRQRRRRDA